MIAADIMTENPRTAHSTDTLRQAVEVLQSLNVRHLPIVDGNGHLIGMLSDRDLGPLLRIFTEGAEAERMIVPLSTRSVSELMSGAPVSVEGDADVSEVVELMLEERVGAVPVVDPADNVIGIISYVDVLRTMQRQGEEEEGEEAGVELSRGTSRSLSSGPPIASSYDVRPWAGGWGVFAGDANTAIEPYRTAADAVAHAKVLAGRSPEGAQVRVYDEGGKLLSEFFHQRDERRALERDGSVPSFAASRPARRRAPRSGA